MSRIPSLGSRGEGWVALQIAAIWLVIATASLGPVQIGDPGVRAAAQQLGQALTQGADERAFADPGRAGDHEDVCHGGQRTPPG